MEKKNSFKISQFDIVDAKVWNDEAKQRSKKSNSTKDDDVGVVNKDCTDPDPKQHKK